MFLELGAQLDLFILNGACDGDETGHYTFISTTGCSVIDYFALSRSLAHLPQKMYVDERIDSQHMPISCVLRCAKSVELESELKPVYIEKLLWMPVSMLAYF